MVNALLSLLFGCRHKRLTRPITPARRGRKGGGITYVACLDCGQSFHYDVVNMRRGEPIRANAASDAAERAKPFESQY